MPLSRMEELLANLARQEIGSDATFWRLTETEAGCVRILTWLRWPNGFRCPNCQSPGRNLSDRVYRCGRDSCRKQTSLTSGTIFERTRKPLTLWFKAMRSLIEDKLNARELQTVLGVSYKTAWTWCHKLRRAMRGAQPVLVPPELPGQLAPLRGLVRQRAVQRLKRGELLVLETHHPEGRPCCGRLDRTEWAVPRDDDGDEHDRVASYGVHDDPAVQRFVQRLWERFHGGLSRKNLAAYAEEDQYTFTRAARVRRDVLTTLASLAVRARPFPYRRIIESTRPQLPAFVEATLPPILRDERETRRARPSSGPTEAPVESCVPVRLDDETMAQLRLDGISLERPTDRPQLP